MAAAPEITPFVLPATPVQLVERQQVTTISVVASSAPSGMSNPDPEPEKKGFPVAVAIPALVGGMAAAFAAFGLWWWCNKRSKRERRERWEAAQRRKQRQRANSAGRPSMSTSRNPSATNLKSMAGGGEKEVVPPVPALPKHYPATEKQHGYGYGGHPQQQQQYDQYALHQHQQQQYGYAQDQHHNQYHQQQQQYQYHTQPTIDENPTSPTYSDHSNSNSSSSGSQSSSTPLAKESKKTSPTKSGSRSTARVAVADSAAATAGLDANVRYQPKKPSPLALKAMEKQNARNEWAEGPFRTGSAGHEEMLAEQDQHAATGGAQASGRNVMSGEWGVALGSPNHDTSASFAEQQASAAGGNNRYSNDPYLSANAGGNRAPSGQYSNDPYAGYHDPVVNSTGKRSNWV